MSSHKERKETMFKEFDIQPHNTGSSATQLIALSARIDYLTEHLKTHAKDFSSKRGLLKLLAQRKKIMAYFSRTEKDLYESITKRLGLK
jgi:small subunit ribosomal protein S15